MSVRAVLRSAASALLPAGLVGFVLWFFGVTWPFALAAGILVLAGALAWVARVGAQSPRYPAAAADPRPGTRSDVVQTAWSLRGRRGEIADAGMKRLRASARRRLARNGWDLDDPDDAGRIRAALGERAWNTLSRRGSRVRIADLEQCLDMLDAMDKTGERAS